MDTKKETCPDAFKIQVASEALRERNTPEEIAAKYEIHPSLVYAWKEALLVGDLFGAVTRLKDELAEATKKHDKVKKELEAIRREKESLLKKNKR